MVSIVISLLLFLILFIWVLSLFFKRFSYFVYSVREHSNFNDLHKPVQLSQYHLPKRLFSALYLPLLLEINWLWVCGFISGLSILLHQCICLFWGPIPCCFNYCSFVVLKPGRIYLLLCFFFFLKIALAILGLLWFHVNFRILHPSFMKNVMGNLIGITLNL